MTAFDYSSGSRITNVLGHTVSTKSSWAGSWTEQPNMTCVECVWTAAPNFNSALIQWETGYVILPGASTPTLFAPFTGRGQFVRIVWQCDDGGTLTWVGFVDSSSWPTEPFGRQQLVCYGLERSLALTPIVTTVWKDGSDPRRSQIAVPFNGRYAGQDGLRSTDPIASGVYGFRSLKSTDLGKPWSTRDIVAYLLKYCLPTNGYEVAAIPWAGNQLTQLPDWDQPIVETQNRTVWDVLNELIGPDKQLGFTVGSDGSTAYLRCFTHLASTFTVSGKSIAANPNQHTVVFAPDALTEAELSDVGGTYDQVIVRGARRKSICTLRYPDSLEKNWTAGEQSDYRNAEFATTGYSGWTLDEKRARNQLARSGRLAKAVFRELRITQSWNWKSTEDDDIFPGSPANSNPRDVRMLEQLPISAGDWKGALDTTRYVNLALWEEGDRKAIERFKVWFTDPTGEQENLELAGIDALSAQHLSYLSDRYDYTVDASLLGRVLNLRVKGAPQHVIASTDAMLTDDIANSGGLDYKTVHATVCLEEDRHCQGVYPSSVSADIVRRLVVDAGDRYQQVYVLPETVTGLDAEGFFETSDGGYLVDDSPQLTALAQLIATGLVPARKRASWRSMRRISGIAVGDLITSAAGASVVAPVTEIRINAPTSTGRPGPAPVQSFATFGGMFDPIAVLRRVGVAI